MLLKEHVNAFYRLITKTRNHTLLCVHADVDALCCAQILKRLLSQDNTPYTAVVIEGVDSLTEKLTRCADQYKDVILINCGAGISLQDAFVWPENFRMFVIDTHR